MIVVGLTGGIGSGKSTVAEMFHQNGVPVYIADIEAKKLMVRSKIIMRKLKQLFGEKAYLKNQLNKPFIAEQIFNDKSLLDKMNAIVHPKVKSHFARWLKKQNFSYVINEAAILFENGGFIDCDVIITVVADKEERIRRIIKRDKSSAAKIKAIMNNQWPDSEKIEKSDFVIVNKDLEDTEAQVRKIHQKILSWKQ